MNGSDVRTCQGCTAFSSRASQVCTSTIRRLGHEEFDAIIRGTRVDAAMPARGWGSLDASGRIPH